MNTVLSPGAHVSYPKAYGQALSVKTTNSPAYAWAYTEEPSIDTLNLQRPSYGPPHVQEPGGHFYGAQETTRNWTGMSQWMNPNQPGYFDKDPHSHGSISYGQHPGGRVSSVTCEGVSSLNMTSLHSCLPLPNPTSLEARRQLPMPTRNQSISSNSSAAPAVKSNSEQTDVCARLSSHDSNPNLGAVNASPMYRNTSGTNWMGSSSGPESRRSSLNNHLVSTLMPPPVSRPSLSSGATIPIGDVPNANITPMGYVTLGIADNEGPTASNVPSFNYSSSCPSNSYASLGSLNLSRSAPSFSSALPAMPSSHDTLFSRSTSPPPTTTLYSYSTDTGSKSDSADQDAGSSGTLVSGQKYAPLHQPPARCESNAEDPRGDRFAGGVQRDTVEDLENRY
ncbi:hypothetical protein EV356DRAFT_533363 [Viridothelium virens]|uniref:Uncharacterized protein n=1 Tax=Viridothelium virens TaxID=1048519 RepID=A0A6A6H6V3_VIRVR|nr:hypothetical protein EV356DRAFT_533363 [Viridothelium virens]